MLNVEKIKWNNDSINLGVMMIRNIYLFYINVSSGFLSFMILIFLIPNALAQEDNKKQAKQFKLDNGSNILSEFFSQGKVQGSFRTLYYSTHNAYFSNRSEDTIGYGGSISYTSGAVNGFSFGLSGILLRGIDRPERNRLIKDIGANQANIGEAYIKYQYNQIQITVGNQRMNLPFAGDWDWRITPVLYQGIHTLYGDKDNFITGARIYRFKPWSEGSFTRKTKYNKRYDSLSNVHKNTDGMWALGMGKSVEFSHSKLQGVAWSMVNYDYVKTSYLEGRMANNINGKLQPMIAIQFVRGTSDGKKLLGKVDHKSYGLQLGLKYNTLLATLNYDHIKSQHDSYRNGALPTPYAHNTSSSIYFAQPFFTSIQDLGAGNAYSMDIKGQITEQLFMGGRYSFMDLTNHHKTPSLNQSEYMLYGIYRFRGSLTGLSINNAIGVQVSPYKGREFWQNRLAIEYNF